MCHRPDISTIYRSKTDISVIVDIVSNITDIGYIRDISTDISDIFIPAYNNVATSRQVCTSKGISQLCRDITAVSQHQLNVATQERQCRNIGINLQHCISMSRHHHSMDLSSKAENFPTYFQCRNISCNP